MTKARLLAILAAALIIAAGLWIAVLKPDSPAPGEVAGKVSSINPPELWLGQEFRGAKPLLAWSREGSVNTLYYVFTDPIRPLVEISQGEPPEEGWVKINTPEGEAYQLPTQSAAVIKAPGGQWLEITSSSGDLPSVLEGLKQRER